MIGVIVLTTLATNEVAIEETIEVTWTMKSGHFYVRMKHWGDTIDESEFLVETTVYRDSPSFFTLSL